MAIIYTTGASGLTDKGAEGGSFNSEAAGEYATAISAANLAVLAQAAAELAETNADADLVLTNADVVLTHADVVLTNADLVLTNADVVSAEADKVQTGLDRIAVAADLVLTNADVVLAEADKVQTGLDRVATNQDVVYTNQDVVYTNADVVSAEADKVQTGLDRIAVAADLVQTAQDTTDTAADLVLTNADVVLTNADVVSTSGDRTAIETIYDTFDDRYLGTKTSDPSLDNDGNALQIGAMYFNSTVNNTKFYNGSTWEDPESTATTGANTATTKANEAAASAAAALVSEGLAEADKVTTNADVVLTNADVVLTNADVVSAEADKVQTGLDRTAVAADLVLTNQDTIDTASDLTLTNADVVLTNADVVLTNADAATSTTQAGIATTKAGEASTSATNAASSASGVNASVTSFQGQYVSQATAPSSPTIGDLWFDETAGIMKVHSGSGFVNAGSSVNGVENSVQHIATASQTTFAATYDAGYLEVYLNGLRLDTSDYTATNGSSVVLDTGAAVDDTVFVHSFGTFQLADHYNKVDADARYAQTVNHYTKTAADTLLDAKAALAGAAFTGAVTATEFNGVVLKHSDDHNLGFGHDSIDSLTTGDNNIGVGINTLRDTTTGYLNVAFGRNALLANTIGHHNTALGGDALVSATANYNTGVGYDALEANTTGASNTVLGAFAGDAITTGSNNTVIGRASGTTTMSDTVLIAAGTTERLKIDASGIQVNGSALAITDTTGLQTALDGKVDDSQVLTNVPSGAVFTDTTYTVGDGGLTEISFTSADNTKLDAIQVGATNYVHPANHAISVITGLQTALDSKTTEAYVTTSISNLVDSSPAALNTLNELAAALGDDAAFSTTVTNSIATKATATDVYTKSAADTLLAGKVDDSQVLTNVPSGAVFTDTSYDSTAIDAAVALNTAKVTNAPDATKLPKAGGTMTGDTLHGDNVKAYYGASNDLQIYHDSSHSYIKDSGTGNLRIDAQSLQLRDTSGYVFINCTDTGSGGTVSLSHNASEKLATTSTGIDVTGTVAATAFTGNGSALTNLPGGGKVLQVVSTTSTSTASTTSSTLTNTGVSLAITPTLSTSKILVMVQASIGADGIYTGVGIRRNSTDIGGGVPSGSRRAASVSVLVDHPNKVVSAFISNLDSPNTTSATTYHITYSVRNSGYTAYINKTGNDSNADYTVRPSSTITLMEIGA